MGVKHSSCPSLSLTSHLSKQFANPIESVSSLLCPLSYFLTLNSKPNLASPYLIFLNLQGPVEMSPPLRSRPRFLYGPSHNIYYLAITPLTLSFICLYVCIPLTPPHATTPEQKVLRSGLGPVSLCMSRASTEGRTGYNIRTQEMFVG